MSNLLYKYMISEKRMKIKGENKIWKNILSKSGSPKKVYQTQLGQQLIVRDAQNMLPKLREWAYRSYKHDKTKLNKILEKDEKAISMITKVLLLLSSSFSVRRDRAFNSINTRHKDIKKIQEHVFDGMDFSFVWRLVEAIVDLSEYFFTEKNFIVSSNKFKTSMKYSCNIEDVIISKLSHQAIEAFYPAPMLSPPVDWSFDGKDIVGGYVSHQYDMIRSDNFTINYENFSPNIFESINYIQSVPWKVNVEIMEYIKKDLTLPIKSDFISVEYPDSDGCEWGIDTKEIEDIEKAEKIENERKVFYAELEEYSAQARDYESAIGKHRAVELALGIAERYRDEEKIYFPHSFDFRGRIYPLPVGLSPQGSDAIKAMLEYYEGESLTEEGEKWAWAYLATLWGDDKIDFIERIDKGKELIEADYKEADEPYQFLAHQLELKKFLKNPDYEFKGRVHLDACNSGSQFTSAMTGDLDGCIATNVIPTIEKDGKQTRQDAYLLVSNKALELTKSEIGTQIPKERESALELLKMLLEENGRKICKRPVMVSNYGGTEGGRTEIIWDMLRELKVDRKEGTKVRAAIYSRIIGDSITGVLKGGKNFERYIQAMNTIIAKKNKPVIWTTGDGFHVTHIKNKELKLGKVKCTLPNSKRETVINIKRYSKDTAPIKMKSAIAPNYVHSLDAELLRRVALKLRDKGIVYTDWIHDSFGCHPNHVAMMLDITKIEFQKMMQKQPLKKLDQELRVQAGRTKPVLKKLEKIKVPINQDFDYRFLELMESEWFFS